MDRVTNVKAIKQFMLQADIDTVSELAERAGIGRSTLSAVMLEKVQPSAPVMNALIQTLDIPLEQAGAIFFTPSLPNT